jgi:hypothetical protein
MQLIVDFLYLRAIINNMKPDINNSESQAPVMLTNCIRGQTEVLAISVLTKETRMRVCAKLFFGVALVSAVVAFGLVSSTSRTRGSLRDSSSGRFPEVVAVAEMPRLVTDTVYVNSVRNVASLPVPSAVN